jgi:hypothetical protein
MKKIIILLIILAILFITFLVFIFKFKDMENKTIQNDTQGNSQESPSYQRVFPADIEKDKVGYDGKKIDITGMYQRMFETNAMEGGIWVNSSDKTVFKPSYEVFLSNDYFDNYHRAKIRIQGTIFTKGEYGHLNSYPYLIEADTIEIFPDESLNPSGYQKATLADIEKDAAKYDGSKVEIAGVYEDMFESHCIDGKIWIESSPETVYIPREIFEKPDMSKGAFHVNVKAQGVVYTQKEHYGHLGMYPYLLKVEGIEAIK